MAAGRGAKGDVFVMGRRPRAVAAVLKSPLNVSIMYFCYVATALEVQEYHAPRSVPSIDLSRRNRWRREWTVFLHITSVTNSQHFGLRANVRQVDRNTLACGPNDGPRSTSLEIIRFVG